MAFTIDKIKRFSEKVKTLKKISEEGLDNLFPNKDLCEVDNLGVGVVVDVESTGLCPILDEVIELAYLEFYYNKETKEFLRVKSYKSEFREPSDKHKDKFCLYQKDLNKSDKKLSLLTNITWEDIQSQDIDWKSFSSICEKADFVIAFNSDFDERMCSKYTYFSTLWYCAYREINYYKKGFSNLKQEVLATEMFNVLFDAHRAIVDVKVLALIISQKDFLKELLSGMVRVEARGFISKEFSRMYFPANRFFSGNKIITDKDGNKKKDFYYHKKMSQYYFEEEKEEILKTLDEIGVKREKLKIESFPLNKYNKFMKI